MVAENTSIISKNVKIEGNLNFPCSVIIDGEVTGDINCEGTLTIDKNAKVISKIHAKDALISGYFEGELSSSGLVEITSTGRFIGTLIQGKSLLSIEKGGLFKAKSIINTSEEKIINK